MEITIYVRENQLAEMYNFLTASIKYEHVVDFSVYDPEYSAVKVNLHYEDYMLLKDWIMEQE